MDIETRRRVCRLITGLVVIDDEIDETEEAFIASILKLFGLGSHDRAALFPILDAREATRELASLPESTRMEAFGLLVAAAASDKRVVTKERDYLHAVGAVLGLSSDDVDARVAKALAS